MHKTLPIFHTLIFKAKLKLFAFFLFLREPCVCSCFMVSKVMSHVTVALLFRGHHASKHKTYSSVH